MKISQALGLCAAGALSLSGCKDDGRNWRVHDPNNEYALLKPADELLSRLSQQGSEKIIARTAGGDYQVTFSRPKTTTANYPLFELDFVILPVSKTSDGKSDMVLDAKENRISGVATFGAQGKYGYLVTDLARYYEYGDNTTTPAHASLIVSEAIKEFAKRQRASGRLTP